MTDSYLRRKDFEARMMASHMSQIFAPAKAAAPEASTISMDQMFAEMGAG